MVGVAPCLGLGRLAIAGAWQREMTYRHHLTVWVGDVRYYFDLC